MTIDSSSNFDTYSLGAMKFLPPSRTLDVSSIEKKNLNLFHLFNNGFSPKEKSSLTKDFVFISNINSSDT